MPRNLCSARPERAMVSLSASARPPQPWRDAPVAKQLARRRAQANRWTLVLAGLSVVCATAEALWMATPGL